MVEGVDERQSRCAVEGPSVVKSSGDVDSRLVDAGNAKVDFSHLFSFLYTLILLFFFFFSRDLLRQVLSGYC